MINVKSRWKKPDLTSDSDTLHSLRTPLLKPAPTTLLTPAVLTPVVDVSPPQVDVVVKPVPEPDVLPSYAVPEPPKPKAKRKHPILKPYKERKAGVAKQRDARKQIDCRPRYLALGLDPVQTHEDPVLPKIHPGKSTKRGKRNMWAPCSVMLSEDLQAPTLAFLQDKDVSFSSWVRNMIRAELTARGYLPTRD